MPRFFLVLLALMLPSMANAEEFSGDALIVNGYTIELGGARAVLWGVNAPNEHETCESSKGKPFTCGLAAKRTLGILIQGRPITCETKGETPDGRPTVLCKLDGFDLAEQLVLNGWAVAYRPETDRYLYSQKTAKVTKSGMWKSLKFAPEQIHGRK